jgi:hypothetical protein
MIPTRWRRSSLRSAAAPPSRSPVAARPENGAVTVKHDVNRTLMIYKSATGEFMIVFRCPCCKIINRAPDEHAGKETYCLKCLKMYTIPTKSEDVMEDQDVPNSPQRSDNLFEPYSEHFGQNTRYAYEYHVFISYANVDADMSLARDLAYRCRDAHWRTFFAPESLHLQNKWPGKFSSRWCGELSQALLSSCHLLCVLSPAHLRSAYCDLEIQGFLRIVDENPSRGIVLVLNDLDAKDVPKSLLPYLCENTWGAIQSQFSQLITPTKLRLGNDAYGPTELFEPLPLTGDSWRFGFGPTEAKRRIYDLYVREYMVLILKDLDPTQVHLNWPMFATDEYKTDALSDARDLIANGVLPYPASVEFRATPTDTKLTAAGNIPLSGTAPTQADVGPTTSVNSTDPSRMCEQPGDLFDLLDYGGRGYTQDMDFVCRKCGYHEGVDNPDEPPNACSKCGATK